MATIRRYTPDDLGQVLALWDDGVELDEALALMRSDGAVTLVAEDEGTIAGVALATVSGPHARIVHVAGGDELLEAIAETRPTLSEEIVSSFDEDVREFARD
jgi:hypothetical protein